MEALLKLAKRAQNLDINKILNLILSDPQVQKEILDLNFQDQLYKQGVDAYGAVLRSHFAHHGHFYADYTILVKERFRNPPQPTDRVTLKDSGHMYSTGKVRLNKEDFEITADTVKEGVRLEDVWGPILGLTEESISVVIDIVKEFIAPIVIRQLLNG